jgi:hypothetical protein
MKKLVLLIVATMAVAVWVAPATAKVPSGNGLIVEVGVTCEGSGGSFSVLVTRGGGQTAWNLTTGQHHVIKSFSGTFTFTPEGGGTPIVETESRSSGQKVGLGTPLSCSQTFTEVIPGVGTVTGVINVEVVAVPPDK